jgi:hypothetical protein
MGELNLIIKDLNFDLFKSFLITISAPLRSLILKITDRNVNYLDGDQWERLIVNNIIEELSTSLQDIKVENHQLQMNVDKLIKEKQKEEKHLNEIKKKCDEKEIFNKELMKNQLEFKMK